MEMTVTRLGAVLLCGGLSSRMGRAKAWLPWRGQPMAAHVAAVLAEAVDEVVVVSSAVLDPPPLPQGVRVVRDEQVGQGPLAGIATGLSQLDAELAFVTSTDAPFLTPAFVLAVLAPGKAAAPVVDGFVQTLAAAYPSEAASLARELLAGGQRRPLHLLEALGYEPLGEARLPDLAALRGFNTPEQYLAAVADDGQDRSAAIEFVGRPRTLAGCKEIEVPIGSLGEVLAHAPRGLELCDGDRVASPFLVSLGGHAFVRDTRIPIGPGERVIVLEASAQDSDV
jgi:molybdopterin-guanine dinucleotide biosynthesis protein A